MSVLRRRRDAGVPARGTRRPSNVADFPTALDLSVFRQMADMTTEAFYLCNPDGRFLYVNDRGCTVGGYSRPEMLKKSVSDVNPTFPRERWAEFTHAIAAGPMPPFETVMLRSNGTLIPIEVSVARLDVGGVDHYFGVIRDLSERKQIEAARKSFTQRLLQTLETERQRVARELHDDVGQAVATIGVLLHTLEQTPGSIAEELQPALATTHATIRQITESVARIVRDYHPAELVGLGLEDTLRSHARQFAQRHRLDLRLATVPVAGLLSIEQELHLYRIVQEALANVARHARAGHVTVRLARKGHRVAITVRDDGLGFDAAAQPKGAGIGLVTMRERASLLGAELVIRARPGHGTEVNVDLPLSR